MRPEFHPAAAEELAAVAVDYEDQVKGLGMAFRTEVARVVALLCDAPRIGQTLDPIHPAFHSHAFHSD